MDITKLETRDDMGAFLTEHGLNGDGAEIGSLNCANARMLISHWPSGQRLHLIDPWGLHDNRIYRERSDWIDFPACVRECEALAAEYAPRIRMMRMRSLDAVGKFEDNSLSFAYIDGDHSFHAVIADAVAWWPKVKPGGILGFHDANYNDVVWPAYNEVKRGVESWNEFMKLPVHITPKCGSAWFVKE